MRLSSASCGTLLDRGCGRAMLLVAFDASEPPVGVHCVFKMGERAAAARGRNLRSSTMPTTLTARTLRSPCNDGGEQHTLTPKRWGVVPGDAERRSHVRTRGEGDRCHLPDGLSLASNG
jgi:hypothetical protein